MSEFRKDYVLTLDNVNNQLDSLIYELEHFPAENTLKIPVEFKHDAYPIIRRLKEAKRLVEESLSNYDH